MTQPYARLDRPPGSHNLSAAQLTSNHSSWDDLYIRLFTAGGNQPFAQINNLIQARCQTTPFELGAIGVIGTLSRAMNIYRNFTDQPERVQGSTIRSHRAITGIRGHHRFPLLQHAPRSSLTDSRRKQWQPRAD